MNNKNTITELLHQLDAYPIIDTPIDKAHFLALDFTAQNKDLQNLDLTDTAAFESYVFDKIKSHGKIGGIGGYLENRTIYQRSRHFDAEENRCMHLGIDLWIEAKEAFRAPFDARVHSFKNNDNFGDYGPTIILEHYEKGYRFYTLYGHLSLASLSILEEGMTIEKGEVFCYLGDRNENGNWPPHLHFQLITDLLNNVGDFPGVCSPSQLSYYSHICLDPMLVLNKNWQLTK